MVQTISRDRKCTKKRAKEQDVKMTNRGVLTLYGRVKLRYSIEG
ncbi:uncharacterized protein PITG_06650 [Phytophthora infestans T30-4]|uniref:Uncharacterized protein n=1 Tax=Phytophthora infestans (strain T30-4) TaxID=403677 RepID=D0N5C3_PHYIT|nr:uncharacterized protein PITG_06650 [Phytophthora infestans T30-4]EEY70081.1 hypothetical protein PITG_06650 [Phytophthora infestans T30-4]|eukprot:XP_002998728.1 hypothetical protein PITG_06650 [Phytophthora infestans T30-4]